MPICALPHIAVQIEGLVIVGHRLNIECQATGLHQILPGNGKGRKVLRSHRPLRLGSQTIELIADGLNAIGPGISPTNFHAQHFGQTVIARSRPLRRRVERACYSADWRADSSRVCTLI